LSSRRIEPKGGGGGKAEGAGIETSSEGRINSTDR